MSDEPYATSSPASETWLSLREVKKMFDISLSSLSRYRKNGELPYSKILRKIYINKKDMLNFIERHKIEN